MRKLVYPTLLILLSLSGRAEDVPSRGNCKWSALPPKAKEIATRSRSLVCDGKIASISLAIAQDGKIVCEQSYGWADREHHVAATPGTPYAAGSVAKSLTGTAVFLLSQRGKLRLNDTPEHLGVKIRKVTGQTITIGELLSMTAGVPHGWFYATDRSYDEKYILQRYAIGAFPAHRSFDYSNLSFGVLGEIVASVSGTPYSRFLDEQILGPLGMKQSGFEPRPENTAVGYQDGQPYPRYEFYPQAAGGFYTSVHDLALFGLFHLGERKAPLSPAGLRALHTPPDIDLSHRGYFAGWATIDLGGQPLWLSNGNVNAGAATLVVMPGKKVVIACATNTPSDSVDETAFQLADTYSPGLMDHFAELRKKVEADEGPKPFKASSGYEGRWVGALEVPGANVPAELIFAGDKVGIAINKRLPVPVKGLRFETGKLMGSADVSVELPGLGSENTVEFELQPDGTRLFGVLRVRSKGNSPGYGLPVSISLARNSHEHS